MPVDKRNRTGELWMTGAALSVADGSIGGGFTGGSPAAHVSALPLRFQVVVKLLLYAH